MGAPVPIAGTSLARRLREVSESTHIPERWDLVNGDHSLAVGVTVAVPVAPRPRYLAHMRYETRQRQYAGDTPPSDKVILAVIA